MKKPFPDLRERLLRAGIAPRHVRRYLRELSEHLADLTAEEQRSGRSPAEARSAALFRLGGVDDLAQAMLAQRQFRSWSSRAPWAAFTIAPILLLTAAWSAALFILWSGWSAFLPEAVTPFGGHSHGFANWYFQLGKAIYFYAPVLIGWGIVLVTARQRLRAIWPAIGLVLIALIGGTGEVHVQRTASGLRQVSLHFTQSAALRLNPGELLHVLVLLSFTTLPYVVWRLWELRSPNT
jgi:hypothetical protein